LNPAAIVEGVGSVLIVTGALFALVGGIGLLRLPDLYSRMHGSGITDTLGATLILLGLTLHSGLSLVTIKLISIWFFLLLTSPTSTHALVRAAISHGIQPWLADDSPGADKEGSSSNK
jgi:multicomponent Na+:H+ antiporter subunit G